MFILVLFAYLCVLPLVLNGATPGKFAMDIRIVKTDGRPLGIWGLFLRNWIGYMASTFPAGLGFAWAFGNAHQQTLHDLGVNTIVVKNGNR